ncbi:hypothetical protein Tco_0466853 [Tanacetum coccineum]
MKSMQCWMSRMSGNPAGISSGKISENSVSKESTSCGTSEIGVFSSSTTKPSIGPGGDWRARPTISSFVMGATSGVASDKCRLHISIYA